MNFLPSKNQEINICLKKVEQSKGKQQMHSHSNFFWPKNKDREGPGGGPSESINNSDLSGQHLHLHLLAFPSLPEIGSFSAKNKHSYRKRTKKKWLLPVFFLLLCILCNRIKSLLVSLLPNSQLAKMKNYSHIRI